MYKIKRLYKRIQEWLNPSPKYCIGEMLNDIGFDIIRPFRFRKRTPEEREEDFKKQIEHLKKLLEEYEKEMNKE